MKTADTSMNMEFATTDLNTAAEAILASALGFTAEKLALPDARSALVALRAGRPAARSYFEYGLARAAAQHLAALDDEVQGVYVYDDEATPEDVAFGAPGPLFVHLIVWARRQTSALSALIAGLDRALVKAYAPLFDAPATAHLLDAQVVDDAAMDQGSGYGALFSTLHHRPLRVWSR